eukprot:GHVO01046187.1.p2 GENE.GHVO01046187.1~~GHVO01046187.1.p2  ORF type:complete len:203 (+),score=20.98 GHVO01046187.1:73-681(+)
MADRKAALEERDRSGSTQSTGSGPRSRNASFCVGRVVVLAIDASENAKNAFEYYIDNVFKPEDTLVLSHIPEAPKLPTFSFKSGIAPPVEEWKKVIDDMNLKTRKLEEDYEGTCIHKKLRYKVRGEAFKNPGEGLCRIAEEEGASLIIMGTRGLNAVKRALLGSVSEYVCRHSGIPTLIVPGPGTGRKRTKSRSGSIPENPK